jgi:hypothetical protein
LNTDGGVWIEQMASMPLAVGAGPGGAVNGIPTTMTQEMLARRGVASPPPEGGAPAPAPPEGTAAPVPALNEITAIAVVFRGVSLNSSEAPNANKEIAFDVQREIRASPWFDPDPQKTELTGEVSPVDGSGTFGFGMMLTLKRPLKL